MKHEEEMERAERAEEAFRQGLQPVPPKPEGASTYFEMSQNSIGMDNNDHAFLVGTGGVPPLPAPSYSSDPGLEPPLNEDVNAVADMLTMPHGGSAFLPPEEPAPPTDEAPADEGEQ